MRVLEVNKRHSTAMAWRVRDFFLHLHMKKEKKKKIETSKRSKREIYL